MYVRSVGSILPLLKAAYTSLTESPKRLVKKKRKSVFFPVFRDSRDIETLIPKTFVHARLPSVKYAVDYKSMIGGYKYPLIIPP